MPFNQIWSDSAITPMPSCLAVKWDVSWQCKLRFLRVLQPDM